MKTKQYYHILTNTFLLIILLSYQKSVATNNVAYPNFELTITDSDNFKTATSVFYIANKTVGFDSGYDSKVFGGSSPSVQVYTQMVLNNSEKLAIQTLPNNDFENIIIPIGLIIPTNETIEFSAIATELPDGLNIFLENRNTGEFINLSENTYNNTFTNAVNGTGQFFIHTTFNITPTLKTNFIWTGATNNDWHTFSNWNLNTVPHATADTTIPADLNFYPTINNVVTVNSIDIASGASLIANTTVISNVTYNRTLTTDWHLISSPLSGETIEDIITNNPLATGTVVTTHLGLAPYNNSGTNPWDYQTTASSGSLNSGQGYSIKLNDATNDVSFTGTINTSNVTFAISMGDRDNFNLLGNPFTSLINSDTFVTFNTSNLAEETIWVWDGSKYITYNNTMTNFYIAPCQSFFVEAANSGNITFSTSNQSHQTDTFMRQEPNPNFDLQVIAGEKSSSTKIFYIDGKTTGFDNGYDSKMFGGTEYDFAVFTELLTDNDGRKLAIQTLPTDNITAIPVGLIANAGEEITFSLEALNLPEDTTFYLEDKITGEFMNLSEGSYKTTLANDTNGIGQFYIVTEAKSLSTDEITENLNNVSIYKSANTEVTIAGLNADADISVFSLLGKQVVKTSINSNGVNTISLPRLSAGVYIVKLNSQFGEVTKKITLN